MDLDALERLANLRNSGVLTPDEFESQKQKLLSAGSAELEETFRSAGPDRNIFFLLALAGLVATAAIFSWYWFSGLGNQQALKKRDVTKQDVTSRKIGADAGDSPGHRRITPAPAAETANPSAEAVVPAEQSGCAGHYLYLGKGSHEDAFSVRVSTDTVRVQWLDYSNAYGPRMTMPDDTVGFVDAQDGRPWALKCHGKNAEIFSPDGEIYGLQQSAEDVFGVASRRWGWQPGE